MPQTFPRRLLDFEPSFLTLLHDTIAQSLDRLTLTTWWKHAEAINNLQEPVAPHDPGAMAWSLGGSLWKTLQQNATPDLPPLREHYHSTSDHPPNASLHRLISETFLTIASHLPKGPPSPHIRDTVTALTRFEAHGTTAYPDVRAIADFALADLRAALHVKTGKPPSAFSPILLITRTLPGEDVPHTVITIAYNAGQPLHDVLALYARQSGYSLTLQPGDRLDFTTYPHLPLA